MTYTIYELKLKPLSGWITDLTADTIFGHLCWQIKYEFWDEVLKEFLEEMEKEPIFTISDVLPYDRLPRPLTEFDSQNVDFWNPTDNSLYLRRKKKYNKNISFIPEDELEKFSNYNKGKIKNLINNKEFDDEINEKWFYFKKRIENKNIINRFSWTTWDKWIYSQEYNEFNENSKNKVVRLLLKDLTNWKLENYKILWKEINFFELFKRIFEIGYWKKKSSWKWQFKVWNWKEKKLNLEWNKNHILLLSSFIPSSDDPTDWNYKIFTKFPKMWEEFSIEWQNFYKKPLVMISAGSTFLVKKNVWEWKKMSENKNRWYVWKMLKDSAIDRKWIYHYAYGFTIEF